MVDDPAPAGLTQARRGA